MAIQAPCCSLCTGTILWWVWNALRGMKVSSPTRASLFYLGLGREGWDASFESSKDGSLGFPLGLCRGGVCVSVVFVWSKVMFFLDIALPWSFIEKEQSFAGLFWAGPVGVSGSQTSLTASFGHLRQK